MTAVAALNCVLPSPRLRRGGVGGGGTMPNRTPRRNDSRVPRARQLRRDTTDAEKKLWQRLRQLPLSQSHFRRQATIGPYFADFACHQTRIVIEIDGGQHAQSVTDQQRTHYLEARGYRVLRFWNNDVLANVDGVIDRICEAIALCEDPPPPTPPHRKRGEGRQSSAQRREDS